MRRCLAALLLALVCAGSALAQTQPEVRKIRFSGARSFDVELLRAAIISDQTSCKVLVFCDKQYLDPVGLSGDIVRLRLFYYQRGYRHAAIQLDTTRKGDALTVRFNINEGVPVRIASIGIKGTESQSLPINIGQPFSLIDYESARDTLRARLQNVGYARAEVLANYSIPRDTPNVAHVEFEAVPGDRMRFGEVEVQGEAHISPSVVHHMLTFGAGDYYSYEDLLQSQRNLFGLETFRHVEIKADIDAAHDTIIPVAVQVNEGNLHRVRFGVGMSTSEFVNAEGLWGSRNFLGGARRLDLRARVYNIAAPGLRQLPFFDDTGSPYDNLSGSASVDFTQPWFFNPKNSLNVGVYIERKSLPNIFVRNARGGYLSVSRALGAGESFSFGYRPELTELSAGGDLVFCVNFLTCGASDIQILREPHWLSPIAASYGRDRANNLISPTDGYTVHVDAEYASKTTGSDFSYARVVTELTRYDQLTRGVVLATRLRPGYATAPDEGLGLHPQKRFFGGGPNSVRGYAQFRMGPKLLTTDAAGFLIGDSTRAGCTPESINNGSCDVAPLVAGNEFQFATRPVGGEAIVEGNVELRLPFWGDKLRAAAFVDFGHVWRQSRDLSLADLVFTPGLGFRYFSAIGPVRIDVGYNPNPSERLEAITTKVAKNAQGVWQNTSELVSLGTVLWNANPNWRDHLQLHFSIGQAF